MDELDEQIGDARTELQYLTEQINHKSVRAERIIQFNLLSLTLLAGILKFESTPLEVTWKLFTGGLYVGLSALSALFCIIVGTYWTKSINQTTSESEPATIGWKQKRLKLLNNRINEHSRQDKLLSYGLICAILTGPLGVSILIILTIDAVGSIEGTSFPNDILIGLALLGLVSVVLFSVFAVEYTREDHLPATKWLFRGHSWVKRMLR